MARIKLIENEQAPPQIAELYQKMESKGVPVLNLYKALATSPPMISTTLKLGNLLLSEVKLSPKLRELVILRVAILAGSEYEWTQHVPLALAFGVTQPQIDDIHKWTRSDQYTDEERAVLQYTDEVALRVKVADDTFEALRGHLDERQIVELTLSIGYWGMVARVLVPLEIEIDKQIAGSIDNLIGKASRE